MESSPSPNLTSPCLFHGCAGTSPDAMALSVGHHLFTDLRSPSSSSSSSALLTPVQLASCSSSHSCIVRSFLTAIAFATHSFVSAATVILDITLIQVFVLSGRCALPIPIQNHNISDNSAKLTSCLTHCPSFKPSSYLSLSSPSQQALSTSQTQSARKASISL